MEWADHYGGTDIGAAGGSGRCSAYGGLQTKGVGVTPLVGHDADEHHSSGAQSVMSAMVEALFAPVYQAALPFGAVPTLAILLVHRIESERLPITAARAITVRPFVLRPAHFMRNVHNLHQRQAEGAKAPGLTRDVYRVLQSLSYFTQGLQDTLGLERLDAATTIDSGLRELARRLACQFAASFAKRLPHGSVSSSNFSLAGQFLDYGMSHFLPTYRRPTDSNQDPWSESQRGLQTVLLLRQQLDKYFPCLRGATVVTVDELTELYGSELQRRLRIEMARMAGLTEDLANACPPELLADWLKAMQGIWLRGGQEPLVPFDASGTWPGLPLNPYRPDLNQVLTQAAPHGNAQAMDLAIAPVLADDVLRSRFVAASMAVRQALRPRLGGSAAGLDAYLGFQAKRKNAVLTDLLRDSWFRITVVTQMMEEDFRPEAVQRLLNGALNQARHTLADLTPNLPGASGIEQIQELTLQGAGGRC